MNRFVLPTALIASALVGCAGPDITMPNPIVAGSLAQNHIVKDHGFAESQNGLPVGSMSDEATIEALDKSQICVNVSLHELAALDLTQAEVKLESSTGSLLQPQLNAEAPSQQTYQGLVPHTEQTGTRLECQSNASTGTTTCQTRPVYTTTMIPGPVDVFNTRGRLCAANTNLVTPATKDLALKISTPTSARGGFLGTGHKNKNIAFRWAFQ
jgi:hypothetical protein